jgi:alpha-tubulin suppressor-like RCC1 family protein
MLFKMLFTMSLFQVLLSCQKADDFFVLPGAAVLELKQGESANSTQIDSILPFDLGRTPTESTLKVSLYLHNSGGTGASLKSVKMISPESELYGYTHNCGQIVEKLMACKLDVYFTPTFVGETSARLEIHYNDGYGERILSQPLKAAANNLAFLRLEETEKDIGLITIGYSGIAQFRVRYNGDPSRLKGAPIEPAKSISFSELFKGPFKILSDSSTCGTTITKDCIVKVEFTPNNQGEVDDAFKLSYFNGAEVKSLRGQVKGRGDQAAILATLSATAVDFGSAVFNAPSTLITKEIEIKFSGSVPATDISIAPPANSAFKIESHTCSLSSLLGNCFIKVRFAPTRRETLADSITLTYRSQSQNRPDLKINLSGKGVNPALIDPSLLGELDFGNNHAYKPNTKSFQLKNIGEYHAVFESPVLTSTNHFTISLRNCLPKLDPGLSCFLDVTFAARAEGVLDLAVVQKYFDGRENQTLNLSGTGAGTAPLFLEAASTLDFGNVMIGHPLLPAPLTNTISIWGLNKLSQPSQMTFSTSELSPNFSTNLGGASNCKAVLNPNISNACIFSVSLLSNNYPEDIQIVKNFSLTYRDDANQGTGTLNFNARFTPRVPPTIEFLSSPVVSPVALNDSRDFEWSLRNRSPYFSVSLKTPELIGSADFRILSNACTGNLSPNAICKIRLRFQPKSVADHKLKIKQHFNNQIEDQFLESNEITVRGSELVRLGVASSALTIDFGTLFVGDAAVVRSVSVNYFGDSTYTLNHNTSLPYAFAQSGCNLKANCTFQFTFNPSSAGTFNQSVVVEYTNALVLPGRITFNLRGVAQQREPSLQISSLNFAKTLLGKTINLSATLQNTGNTEARNIKFSLASGDYAFTFPVSGGCSEMMTLSAGSSCKIDFTFAPTQIGQRQAEFSLNYDSPFVSAQVKKFTLTGTGTQLIQLALGGSQTCLIDEVSKIRCTGKNNYGQFGLGHTHSVSSNIQTVSSLDLGSNVIIKQLSVNDNHSWALYDEGVKKGVVTCWGYNLNGRLAQGSTAEILSSPFITGGTKHSVDLGGEASAVSVGFEHTCALLKTGDVKCWGMNSSGQLGVDSIVAVTGLPQQVSIGGKAIQVSAGAGHTCVTIETGKVRCFGDNFYGQLGQGTTEERMGNKSGDMAKLSDIKLGAEFTSQSVLASNGAFSCSLATNGSVKCWGKTVSNEESSTPFWGILGQCYARNIQNSPVQNCESAPGVTKSPNLGTYVTDMPNLAPVSLASGADKIASGLAFTCALLTDKSIKCFGDNKSGQLGLRDFNSRGESSSQMGASLPRTLSSTASAEILDIGASAERGCALLSSNHLSCWGQGSHTPTIIYSGN